MNQLLKGGKRKRNGNRRDGKAEDGKRNRADQAELLMEEMDRDWDGGNGVNVYCKPDVVTYSEFYFSTINVCASALF